MNKITDMIKVIILASLASCVYAQQQPETVVYDVMPNSGDGLYSFRYHVSDDTVRSETGRLQKTAEPEESALVQGTIQWISPEGWIVQISYSADQNGYQPHVTLLPSGDRNRLFSPPKPTEFRSFIGKPLDPFDFTTHEFDDGPPPPATPPRAPSAPAYSAPAPQAPLPPAPRRPDSARILKQIKDVRNERICNEVRKKACFSNVGGIR